MSEHDSWKSGHGQESPIKVHGSAYHTQKDLITTRGFSSAITSKVEVAQ